jgi:hypothetical protein
MMTFALHSATGPIGKPIPAFVAVGRPLPVISGELVDSSGTITIFMRLAVER